ncbi:MAG: hypothetical protein IJ002_05025, partial [Clostridia bacterium]|nr:hypothetical protein [Clostridia bacterium]
GLKMGNEGTTVPGTGFPGVNKFRAYVFGGYENVADVADGTEMNTDITIRSGEYWFVAGWNRSKNGDTVHPENNGTGKITVGKVNDEDTLFIAYFVGYSVFNQYLNDDSKVTITIDGDVGIYKFVPLNHDGSRTVEEADLFETDVLLLKDSSINSGDSIPDTVVEDLTKYTTNAKVTIYADLRNEATLDEANHIKTYFDNRAKAGYVCEVHSYVEYCAKYFDGHTYVDGECSECGADENCPHESFETVTLEQPTCVANGKAYDMCNVCFARIKNKTDREYVDNNGTYKTAKDANAHLKSWVGDEYKCIRDGCGKVFGTGSTFYVSDNGNANGGFSATNPADDFAAIFEIASGCGSNATIYVVGSVSISHGYIDYDRAVFAEPNHQNEITVSGYNGLGVIKLKGENSSKIVYALNGPTTFENIEFSTRGYKITVASRYMYFVAQHNHLTFGEHIAFDFQRNAYESNMPCTPIIVGGCYNKKFAVNKDDNILATQCTGAETHITLKSGTFSDLRGGSVGGACGTPTINVEILGDVSFRKTVALGSSFNRAGDVNFTLDGSLVVNNYLSFGGENTAAAPNGANVGVVTLKLLNGSLHSQSFQTTSSTIRPLGASAFAEKDESGQSVFQVTKNLDKLRIYYDASAPSAVVTANRFKEMGDYADQSKIEYGFIDTLCTVAANGEHNNGGATGTRVDATCSIGAYTEYICSDCGKHYVVWDTDNPKLGHSFDTGVIAIVANCISPDILEMTCTRDGCDHSEYVVKEGSAPITDAHEFNDGICAYCQKTEQDVCAHDGAITTPYKTACGVGTKTECPVCHKVTIDVVSSKHNFGAYVVTVAPTENVPGIKTRTCKSCKKVETAVIYADGGAISSSAIATDASGNLANLDIIASKLTKAEKALLTAPSYGSELKISYKVEGDVVTGIIYSIPLPAEYKDYKNVQIVVKDDDGETYLVDFKVEKGYLVFEF